MKRLRVYQTQFYLRELSRSRNSYGSRSFDRRIENNSTDSAQDF
jgi:hypothetical protein